MRRRRRREGSSFACGGRLLGVGPAVSAAAFAQRAGRNADFTAPAEGREITRRRRARKVLRVQRLNDAMPPERDKLGNLADGRKRDYWICKACRRWEWRTTLRCRCGETAPRWVLADHVLRGERSGAKGKKGAGKGAGKSTQKSAEGEEPKRFVELGQWLHRRWGKKSGMVDGPARPENPGSDGSNLGADAQEHDTTAEMGKCEIGGAGSKEMPEVDGDGGGHEGAYYGSANVEAALDSQSEEETDLGLVLKQAKKHLDYWEQNCGIFAAHKEACCSSGAEEFVKAALEEQLAYAKRLRGDAKRALDEIKEEMDRREGRTGPYGRVKKAEAAAKKRYEQACAETWRCVRSGREVPAEARAGQGGVPEDAAGGQDAAENGQSHCRACG